MIFFHNQGINKRGSKRSRAALSKKAVDDTEIGQHINRFKLMSGHSKWSTIKRAKGAKDAKRSDLFSKLAKQISIAVREGGGSGDPTHNFKLRLEIERAKAQSLPNANIERAIKKGLGQEGGAMIEKIIYEGYGPFGVPLLIVTATDNKNRTVASIKHILNKNNGSLGAQNSVAWQFQSIGQILVERTDNLEDLQLVAIDNGATDVKESQEGLEIEVNPESLEKLKAALEASGAKIVQAEVIQQSTQPVELDQKQQQALDSLIEQLEDDEDVTAVHAGIKI